MHIPKEEPDVPASPHPEVAVVLLDRHALTRHCIATLIMQTDPRLFVHAVGRIADLHTVPAGLFDVLLWYLGAARITQDAATAELRRLQAELPGVPLVVLSKHDDPAHAVDAIRLGARGHIPASSSLPVMVAALRLVHAGGVYVAPLATDAGAERSAAARAGAVDGTLTNREEEVLTLLRLGKANKIIAHELGMSENTVKVHVRRIIKKLHVMNRTEAAFVTRDWSGLPAASEGIAAFNEAAFPPEHGADPWERTGAGAAPAKDHR